MDTQLQGKTALVTGSTQGIGFAIAAGLAREGASVTVNGRTEEKVAKAVAKIRESSAVGDVRGVAAELGTAEGAEKLFAALPDVDILVNNLGIFEAKPFAEIPDEDWRRFFDVNVLSGVRLSRRYLPGMTARNWGRILFISSESALQIPVEMIHYGMTKTAQIAVARGIAETTAGTGVTVNSLLPGPTRSEGVEGFVQQMAQSGGVDAAEVERQFFEKARPTSLLKRFTAPDEIAAMAVFLCSPLSVATNGAAIRVDGGVVKSAF